MRGEHPVRLLCEVLDVAVSGYYRWRTHPRSTRAIEDERLADQIGDTYAAWWNPDDVHYLRAETRDGLKGG